MDEVAIVATLVKTLAKTIVRDISRRASTLDFSREEQKLGVRSSEIVAEIE
jgi:hypothetical protein